MQKAILQVAWQILLEIMEMILVQKKVSPASGPFQ